MRQDLSPAKTILLPAVPQESQAVLGLNDEAVAKSVSLNGRNILITQTAPYLLVTLKEVVTEPMFLLLLVACGIYVAIGSIAEAITLGIALLVVSGISVYQSIRSDQALGALHELTQPKAQVWRNGVLKPLPVEDIVVGDTVLIEEGERISADGVIQEGSDFSLDESILTGEAVSVTKSVGDQVFAGTTSTTGSATFTVSAVGKQTELGKIGHSIGSIKSEKTLLQLQVNQFVMRMAWIGVFAFLLVWGVNYYRSGNWLTALLFGLTLAMSVLPEEIPVAFSSFMALGAARLSRMGVLTKQPQTVESLGSATVICTDKTGTITQTGMAVRQVYDGISQTLVPLLENQTALPTSTQQVLAYARWASENDPFDEMEKAIVAAFSSLTPTKTIDLFPMVQEYPLDGSPPMMTHVRQASTGEILVAGKGAVEHILAVCRPTPEITEQIRKVALELSTQGLRVLGVARGTYQAPNFPKFQDDFNWSFLGLVALENPPKANAAAVVRAFNEAGIRVKLITGDYPQTAQAIARQVGLQGAETLTTGEQIMKMDDATLKLEVAKTAVFARMFPEAKLRVVGALKQNGEVVAMTGDGVNDGPALKAAHIGVAMGKRGTEVAKQAASLVLVNDDLSSMVDAIAQGRRIYQNFKKAVSYIVSIHIPIILTVAVPLLANWRIANLFSPVHIIFLELVMGPTCSIAFENEPAEKGQMQQAPRPLTSSLFAGSELAWSIAQGLGITLAVLGVYFVFMQQNQPAGVIRTLVFSTLVLSNIFLTLVNRSFRLSVLETLGTPNKTLWLMLGLTLGLLLATLFIDPAQQLFGFSHVSNIQFAWCVLAALIGVGWIEAFKTFRSGGISTSVLQH
jgi:P-type Ca2+ transporter type 2C